MTTNMVPYALRALRAARDLDERDVDALVRRARREGAGDEDIVRALEEKGARIDPWRHPWVENVPRVWTDDEGYPMDELFADGVEAAERLVLLNNNDKTPGVLCAEAICRLTGEHAVAHRVIDEQEPPCLGDGDHDDHDWGSDPGTIIRDGRAVIVDVCRRCKVRRITDTAPMCYCCRERISGHEYVTYEKST